MTDPKPTPKPKPTPGNPERRTKVLMGYSTAGYKNACKNVKQEFYVNGLTIKSATDIYQIRGGREQRAPYGYYSDGDHTVKYTNNTIVFKRCASLTPKDK